MYSRGMPVRGSATMPGYDKSGGVGIGVLY